MGWGGENAGGEGYRAEEDKGERKRDNCNSIINKIYFKEKGVLSKWAVRPHALGLQTSPSRAATHCILGCEASGSWKGGRVLGGRHPWGTVTEPN